MTTTQPESTTKQPYQDISYESANGDAMTKRMPVDYIPSYARVGMVVVLTNSTDGDYAKIVSVTPSHAIVQKENGKHTAYAWQDVYLTGVMADPSAIGEQTPQAGDKNDSATCPSPSASTSRPCTCKVRVWTA